MRGQNIAGAKISRSSKANLQSGSKAKLTSNYLGSYAFLLQQTLLLRSHYTSPIQLQGLGKHFAQQVKKQVKCFPQQAYPSPSAIAEEKLQILEENSYPLLPRSCSSRGILAAIKNLD
ncbi:hypothetical protein O6H91_16G003800 [Diphasiastrum complanatum]|uniref:Uncharacterized protein n=2 Tax=Diphasiastrum complanatum TaxID=34168 RepID=A0ACC2B9F4_DIPCM|nr:hypothetical protein O6H91_16G002900 [Diphasiastrum complanatum]KAJ7526373.1 hypothetical protein O6H91_16G003800 [Diphasiastrum complanatum]